MFILPHVFFRLLTLHFLYIVSLFLWWDIFGIWTTFFALIPLIVFVYFFSLPVLVYFSLLLCTLLSTFAMGISLHKLGYDKIFWGIQSFLLSVSLGCSLIKSKRIPPSLIKKQNYFKRCLNDKMVVSFDPLLHTIYYISPSACKLYGWKKKDLIGKSLGIIYPINLFDHPPIGFWESLNEHRQWCGAINIITKDQVVCEEIACYTAVLDDKKQIILIEKKILEVFIKQAISHHTNWFHQFYEENPIPMAVINQHHRIELANPSFIKEFSIKPTIKTIFTDLFLDELQEDITQRVNECWEGKTLSFNHQNTKFIFSPYYHSYTVTHVLCTIQKEYIEILNPVNITNLLKDSLTDWYLTYPNTSIKLFTTGIPPVWVDPILWEQLMKAVFFFVDQYLDYTSRKIIVLGDILYFQYFFRICFEGLPFSQKDTIVEKMKPIFIQLEKISTKYSMIKGEYEETVLLLEFYGNPIEV
ncbi:MAG: PAS domain-containing protein [Brevinema sp.]